METTHKQVLIFHELKITAFITWIRLTYKFPSSPLAQIKPMGVKH